MDAGNYLVWRERILVAVRHRDLISCRQAWESLYLSPGFAGIRSQVGKLVHFFRAEWQRVCNSPFPFAPRPLRYVQRLRVQDNIQMKRQAVRSAPVQ